MKFRNRRSISNTGGAPGLTPIDDINNTNRVSDLDPDPSTGRLPIHEDSGDEVETRRPAAKRRRKKM
jgi:hypothetical protein